jgi:hypothetical protein
MRKKGYSAEQALLAVQGSTTHIQPCPVILSRPSAAAAEPSASKVRLLVDQLKAKGLMTELPSRHEIVSDAHVLPIRKPDETGQITFNPSQPIVVPVPTHAEAWKPAEPVEQPQAEAAPDPEPDADWLRLFVCAFGTLICSLALITYGARAGGNTFEAWFWSCMIVIPGSILLALPFRWWLPASYIHKVIGIALIVIGYTTMHASIETTGDRAISAAAAGSTEVQQLKQRIADLEAQLKPRRDAISQLHPVRFRGEIEKRQAEAKPLEDSLSAARDALVAAQNKAITKAGAGEAGRSGLVEWLRRLMLEPLNILCLHGFLESLPAALKALRRRKDRLAVAWARSDASGNRRGIENMSG